MEDVILPTRACKMAEKSSLAAYLTGRERIAKVTPLPYGLSTMALLYQ